MWKIVSVGLLFVMILAFSNVANAEDKSEAMVRILHATPDAPAVDVYVNNELMLEAMEFTDVSEYIPFPSGIHSVEIFGAGDTDTAVASGHITVEAGEKYTLAAIGEVEAMSLAEMVDDQGTSTGKAKIRVAQFLLHAPALDVATTSGDLLFTNLFFPHTAEYVEIDPRTYELEFREAQSEEAMIELAGLELKEGTVYTAIVVGLINSSPEFEVLLLTDHLPTPDDLPKTGLGGASEIR